LAAVAAVTSLTRFLRVVAFFSLRPSGFPPSGLELDDVFVEILRFRVDLAAEAAVLDGESSAGSNLILS
jgi:hypothetical protein